MRMGKHDYHDLRRDRTRLPHKPKRLLTSSFAAKALALCLIVFLGVLLLDHPRGQPVFARLSGLHRS